MPEIISAYHHKGNVFKSLWHQYRQLDRVLKIAFVTYLLIVILTPFIVSNYQIFKSKAQEAPISSKSETDTELRPEYAPGEVLIKFKEQKVRFRVKEEEKAQGVDLDKKEVQYNMLAEETILSSLRELHKKNAIKQIEKVFKGASSPQEDITKFKNQFSREISEGKRHVNESKAPQIDLSRTFKISLENKDIRIEKVIQDLSKNPEIEYAEPNFVAKKQVAPNDPYYLDKYPDNMLNRDPKYNPPYDYQWNLKKINMEQAWEIASNAGQITVAVIDTGVDYTHPELGGCSIDQVRDNLCSKIFSGYDFVNNDDDPMDDHGHGTHVAGIIAGLTNNNYGIAGISWNTRILPVKGLDYYGFGRIDDLAEAIRYAASNGARVINMSWGYEFSSLSKTLQEGLDFAKARDITLVAAAGNSNVDLNYGVWPADYPSVMAVSATDYEDKKADLSNYGTDVAVAAPGVNILSLKSALLGNIDGVVGNQFLVASGTSMASPHVAGLASLVLAVQPTLMSDQVEAVIKNGAQDIEVESNTFSGHGRIDAGRSLRDLDILIPPKAKIYLPKLVNIGGIVSIPITAGGDDFESWVLSYALKNSNNWIEIKRGTTPTSEIELISWDTTLDTDGEYTLMLEVKAHQKIANSLVTAQKDSRIMDGWPVNILHDFNFPFYEYNRVSVISDVNKDQKDEIVLLINDTLHIYAENGTELVGWPKDLRIDGKTSYINTPPAVGELDQSYPGLEIAIARASYKFNPITENFDDQQIEILVFHQDGTFAVGFPYIVTAAAIGDNLESLIFDDITGDGILEILFLADIPSQENMYMYVRVSDDFSH